MDHTTAITQALDRLDSEVRVLKLMFERTVNDADLTTHLGLLRQQSKRVRTTTNLCVRAIARYHDELQP